MPDKKKKLLFRFLYHFHIYGGLFCSVYLFFTGLSALNIQHHLISDRQRDTVAYDRTVMIDSSLKPEILAGNTMQQLNIVGYYPPWEFKRNDKVFSFKIFRPARHYNIAIDLTNGNTHIDRINFGIGAVINVLHTGVVIGLNDPLLKIWAYYGQLSALIAILAIATGIYSWFKKSIRNKSEWIISIACGLITIFFIVYLWLIG